MKVNNEMVEKVLKGVQTVVVVILTVLWKIFIAVFKFGMGVWAKSSSYFESGKEYNWEEIQYIPLDPIFVTAGDLINLGGFRVKRLGTFMVTPNNTFIFEDDQPKVTVIKDPEPIDPEVV